MKKVGVRELKENLSRYLQRLKSGERIEVTDGKKEVALLVPIPRKMQEQEILELIQKGIAYWAGGKPTGMPSPIVSKGKMVSEAVIEDRR
jgi:antitoxin (DNA-binding transcriptional repressor) of toxin-antitoxin stability system